MTGLYMYNFQILSYIAFQFNLKATKLSKP